MFTIEDLNSAIVDAETIRDILNEFIDEAEGYIYTMEEDVEATEFSKEAALYALEVSCEDVSTWIPSLLRDNAIEFD